MRRPRYTSSVLAFAGALALGACSVHSLDYLSSGYTPDPPLPPETPASLPYPDAGARPDAPAPDAAPSGVLPDAAPARDLGAAADQGGSETPPLAPPAGDAGPAEAPEVFFIVGQLPLGPADTILERRVRALGLRVVTVVDDLLATVDTGRAALILISPTISVMAVGARFRDVAKPVVVSEPLLYDDMGMVESTVPMGVNRGADPGLTAINIEQPASPLAASLSGSVTVARQATSISWGIPNANAIRVASVSGQSARVALMAYETGQRMPELVAPARRVGLFLSDQSALVLTSEGFALFDAAITWALSP